MNRSGSEADTGTGREEVQILGTQAHMQAWCIQRVVLVRQPELHGRRIDVLDDANAPVGQLVTRSDVTVRNEGARNWRARINIHVLTGALPLAVLAVQHCIADPEEVPCDATRQIEEACTEVAANIIIVDVAVTRGAGEEQARRHMTDRQRADKLAHILVAVRRAEEVAGRAIILRPDRVADGAGNADTIELTGIAQCRIPVVVLTPRSAECEAGDRRRAILDMILALVQPVTARSLE